MFGSGTAVVISPVATIGYQGTDYTLKNNATPVTDKIYKCLTDIQYGRAEDTFGWTVSL